MAIRDKEALNNSESHLQMAQHVAKVLRDSGVRVHPLSRIEEMLRLLRNPASLCENDSAYAELFAGIHDLYQLRTLVDAVNLPSTDASLAKGALEIVSDVASPTGGKRLVSPEDQFRLYFTVVCAKSGFPARVSGPRICITVGEATVAASAHSVHSVSKLASRVGEGAKNVYQSGNAGIVVVDLSVAWSLTCFQDVLMSEKLVRSDVLHARIRNFVADHRGAIGSSVADKGVAAVVAHVSTLRPLPNERWRQDVSWVWFPTTAAAANSEWLHRLQDCFTH